MVLVLIMELYYEKNFTRKKIGDPLNEDETYTLIFYYLKELNYRPYRIQSYTSSDLQFTYYDFGVKNERFVRVNNLINLTFL